MPCAGIVGPIMRPRLSARYVGDKFRRAAVGDWIFGQRTGKGPAIEAAPETVVRHGCSPGGIIRIGVLRRVPKGTKSPVVGCLTTDATVRRHRGE